MHRLLLDQNKKRAERAALDEVSGPLLASVLICSLVWMRDDRQTSCWERGCAICVDGHQRLTAQRGSQTDL